MFLYGTRFQDKLPVLIKEKEIFSPEETIRNPEQAYRLCTETLKLQERTEEYVYAFALDSKCNILGGFEISHGTVNLSLISPRELYIRMLLIGAVSAVLVHNHPSQDATPSAEDFQITKRIHNAGKLIGISLRDHIILAKNEYYSMYEHEIIA